MPSHPRHKQKLRSRISKTSKKIQIILQNSVQSVTNLDFESSLVTPLTVMYLPKFWSVLVFMNANVHTLFCGCECTLCEL